jgi:HEAT repeat protein
MPSEATGHPLCRRLWCGPAHRAPLTKHSAFGRIGGAALVLVLVSFLPGCGDSEFDKLLAAARDGDVEQQQLALRQLAEMGPRASAAIPDLIVLTGHADADVRRLAGLALGNVAAAAGTGAVEIDRGQIVAALGRQLEDDNVGVRHSAAFALLGLHADHNEAQRCLLMAMRRGDGGTIDRLKSMHPPPTWAVPTLVEILRRDRRAGIRRLSAVTLGAIAPGDADVRAALQQALQDEDDRVRDAAREALQDDQPGT